MPFHFEDRDDYVTKIIKIGQTIGGKLVLVPTSDELTITVAQHREKLSQWFMFPDNCEALVTDLASKKDMYHLAIKCGIPTPKTIFPLNKQDVLAYMEEAKFPVMLKGIYGNRLAARTGKKMVLVNDREQLLSEYEALEEPSDPNVMVQEYIPGWDDQIYIFNGYFDENSECLAGFTGRKIRQYPIHVGCASLGEAIWNEEVASTTIRFMKSINYKGILDIGYRFDPRDGLYKVLDINPRVGQAFRLFIGEDGTDVVQVMYRDLTGQAVHIPRQRLERRWVIEDYDLESSWDYWKEGTLQVREWMRSYRKVEEGAWFHWKDPRPFASMCKLSRQEIARSKKTPRYVATGALVFGTSLHVDAICVPYLR